ncbi:MAG TPA: HEAT repeat domain-containing protein, partial [Polyangiaceae bacterium]
MRPALAGLLAASLWMGGAFGAHQSLAKPAATSKAPAIPQVQLPPGTLDKLHSSDPASIKAALDDIRTAGKGAQAAAPPIATLLDHGLTTELTIAALDTLGDVEAESSSPSIAAYAVHRNTTIRQAAVRALVRTKGAAAVTALRHALSDQDAVVRGLAATGLGALKAKEAVHDLFVALDHKVAEAAASIGQLCSPKECDELMSKLGKLPFDVVTGGVDQVLFRPPTEIDDDQKVSVIGRLREVGTGGGEQVPQGRAKAMDRVAAGEGGDRTGGARHHGGVQVKRAAGLVLGALATALVAAACGGGTTSIRLFSTDWSNDGGKSMDALRQKLAGKRPPVGTDVVVAVAGNSDKIVGLPLGGGSKWTVDHTLDARPVIAGTVVVCSGGGELFALDAATGRKLWTRPTGGLKVHGAGDDGNLTVVTMSSG